MTFNVQNIYHSMQRICCHCNLFIFSHSGLSIPKFDAIIVQANIENHLGVVEDYCINHFCYKEWENMRGTSEIEIM
jgi:hypothetical protein